MKTRTREFDLLIQEAFKELYYESDSFSTTESETEEEQLYVVDDIDYDGVAELFKQTPVKPTATIEAFDDNHDVTQEKANRDFERYRDAHNKAKLASKIHRFEMAAKRENDAFLSMGPKEKNQDDESKVKNFSSHNHSQALFFNQTGRNNRRYQTVREALSLDKDSLAVFKK